LDGVQVEALQHHPVAGRVLAHIVEGGRGGRIAQVAEDIAAAAVNGREGDVFQPVEALGGGQAHPYRGRGRGRDGGGVRDQGGEGGGGFHRGLPGHGAGVDGDAAGAGSHRRAVE